MYPTLYNARQSAASYLPRQWYYDDALALPWVRSITIKVTDQINKQHLRGLIFASNKQTHGGMTSFDYTIVIAEGLPIEYERFVTIKELMHCYFAPSEENVRYLTSTELALDNHMSVLFGGSTAKSAQSRADKMAVWMAVGVICTEHDRKVKIQANDPGRIVADMNVPLKQAKNMISRLYVPEIQRVMSHF